MIRRFFLSLVFAVLCQMIGFAQTHLRIHHHGGGYSDVAIEQIDSVTFVDGSDVPSEEASLVGSWLWGDATAGYYELLTFNDDKTYTGYDNYFTYGFDTMTYGWYGQYGAMLTLQSNGFGYSHRYNWFLMGLTDNALDVMTKMGRFTYYRLQPEVIRLQEGEELPVSANGDHFVFADGVVVCIDDGKLKGISKGMTYVQKCLGSESTIKAYQVVVE